MANKWLKHIVIFDVCMMLRYLLQDKLCGIVDLGVIKDKTNVHNDQDDITFLEVKVDSSPMSNHCSW